jgi:myo-inositol 2-dehydrogenase/D-chiro-inositol 1-dehydrogenase
MWTLKLHAAWRTSSKSEHCYDNLDALLERKDIDAVVIASPSKFQLCAVQTAAASGKHIFCEKLLAVTIEEVDAAIAAAERPRFCCRWASCGDSNPAHADANCRIEAGEIGTPIIFRSIGRDREPRSD